MRQATGKTNSRSAVNQVSIQLALDGHSFSVVGRPAGDAAEVTAEVLTQRTLLVPEALFAPERAAALLAADGKAPQPGDMVVCSLPQEGVVAVMALPEQALAALHERIPAGADVRFTTPLLDAPQLLKPAVLLHPVGGYLYIKVYDADGLQLAEVFPAPADEDILYLLERLEGEFPARNYALHLRGLQAKQLAKRIGKFYDSVRCE